MFSGVEKQEEGAVVEGEKVFPNSGKPDDSIVEDGVPSMLSVVH